MRLLQLALSHDEMLDLHPLVSVVSELDEEGRRRLVDVIVGLANATAVGPKGLLEAHGVLFDLSTDMLELLDIRGGEAQPVVTADELPARLVDPRQRERSDAERALAEVDGRRASARETQLQAQAVVTSARDAVERAQERQASLATRSASIAGLEAALADAVERRSRLEGQHAEVSARAAAAVAHRAEVEASTAALRDAPLEATRRRADLAERLDGLRAALDPGVRSRLMRPPAPWRRSRPRWRLRSKRRSKPNTRSSTRGRATQAYPTNRPLRMSRPPSAWSASSSASTTSRRA